MSYLSAQSSSNADKSDAHCIFHDPISDRTHGVDQVQPHIAEGRDGLCLWTEGHLDRVQSGDHGQVCGPAGGLVVLLMREGERVDGVGLVVQTNTVAGPKKFPF